MLRTIIIAVLSLSAIPAVGQAALQPVATHPPTLEEVRKGMGIPSQGDVRGQQDIVGFASKADQMVKVWELSATLPAPESLGPSPKPGVAGIICAHDDYLYAGRVYRQVMPLVTAKTVVLVGVFHKYRRFGVRDVLVFDPYRAWHAPDGEIKVSELRGELLSKLPAVDFVQDAAMHDGEHSLEALAYWLKHVNKDVEIVPIIVPTASFGRFEELTAHLGKALASSMKNRGWTLGRDVAIVISSDAVHYGSDFKYTPYGEGGIETYKNAYEQDVALLKGPLAGPVSAEKAKQFFATCVNPDQPNDYRLTWCGRFAIPVGLLLLNQTAEELGLPAPVGYPIAYGTSVGTPELPIREVGLGETAPANLYHFVGLPAEAYVIGK